MPDSPYEVRLKADMTEVGLAVSDLYAQTAETELTGSALLRNAPSDRKSTRLNSSHLGISYAVFCLKTKQIT